MTWVCARLCDVEVSGQHATGCMELDEEHHVSYLVINGVCDHDVPWQDMPYSHYSMFHKEDHP